MIENSVSGVEISDISEEFQKQMDNLKNLIQNTDIKADENYLKRYLYGTNFNVDEAFRKIKAIQEHMTHHQDWYRKDGPLKCKRIIDQGVRMVLPDCDKEGRPIYIAKNGNIDTSTMDMLDVVFVDDIWIESLLSKHPEAAAKGLCVIMDIKNQSWKLTKWMQPDNIKQSFKKLENLPFKDYKVHVINNSWWISIAIKCMWPFLPQKYKDMITFHFDNMETFYEYIDKKVLPIEYGGSKEIKYSDLYDNLYKRNDEIFKSFDGYRDEKKS